MTMPHPAEPQQAAKKPSNGARIFGLAVASVAALCCIGGVVSVANGGKDSGGSGNGGAVAEPAATTAAASPGLPDRVICQVAESGGSFYLLVTSGTDHNFKACAAAKPYAGTIDTLLALPGMDRRCILDSNQSIVAYDAIVGVYSDRKAPDLAAAKAFCDTNGRIS